MSAIPAFILRRFGDRPGLVKIVENIGWLFFDKILRLGVGFFVGIWIARYLGPEQFGLLSFLIALTGLLGALSALGLPGVIVRDLVQHPESASVTLGTAVLLRLVGGLAAYLLAIVAIGYLRPDDDFARGAVAILGLTMLFKSSDVAVYWFESQVRSKYTVWVQNTGLLMFALIKIYLIFLQAPLIAFVWAILAETVVVAVLLLVILSARGLAIPNFGISVKRATDLLSESWPLLFSAIAVSIYMKIDQIMLGQMLGDHYVGIYSVAVRISEIWYFIPVAIAASTFPALLEAKERSNRRYYTLLQQGFDVLTLIAVSVSLLVTLLSTRIVELLFGQSYDGADTVLTIHVWASIFVFLGVLSSRWFLAENRQKLLLLRTLLGAITNVLLNIWLIPAYGAVGAAVATVVSYSISAFFADLVHQRTRRLFIMKVRSLNLLAATTRLATARRKETLKLQSELKKYP